MIWMDLSIPLVSTAAAMKIYPRRVREKTPLGWGARFREYLRAKESNLAKIAEKMNLAESTLRSWTNGTRDINLSDFLLLCKKADLDPATVLFAGKVDDKFLLIGEAWNRATPEQRGYLLTTARGILADDDRGTSTGEGIG